jgi:LmbE family N-acetylglucosaminyl deacetylase
MTIIFRPLSALALAPHPDDIELGMGGTISKLVEDGCHVVVVVFSSAEKSLPEGFTKENIKDECRSALESLGVERKEIYFEDFPVREFDKYRQEILELLVGLSRKYLPDVVFCPSLNDSHQDHHVLANESVRAFRKTTVLGYELPWNTKLFDSSLSIGLETRHMDAKEKSLEFYHSQRGRPYFESGLLRNHARMRATVAGLDFVESFELIRMLLR